MSGTLLDKERRVSAPPVEIERLKLGAERREDCGNLPEKGRTIGETVL